MAKKPKDTKPKGHPSPWLEGVRGVTGVIPPGRKLSDDPRRTKWSASGVSGVTPPGNQKPGEGPGIDWADKMKKGRSTRTRDNRRALDKAKQAAAKDLPVPDDFDPMRPMEGFIPDIFADLSDPDDMKSFLERISRFVAELGTHEEAEEDCATLITQSHAPFEIVVAFSILSAIIGKQTAKRRRYGIALERGAKVFFNMARRLKNDIKTPRGLVPETVDALFYDIPSAAYQVPYAYATDAFLRMMELLRDGTNEERDLSLGRFAEDLHGRFIGRRSFGDQPLSGMFPYDPPEWTSPPRE